MLMGGEYVLLMLVTVYRSLLLRPMVECVTRYSICCKSIRLAYESRRVIYPVANRDHGGKETSICGR